MTLLGLLLIPMIVSAAGFLIFRAKITWKEFLLQVVISVAIITAGYFIARWSSLEDIEHLNGKITDKAHGSQKCCHCSLVCNGYTTVCSGSGTNRTCTQQCTGYHEVCSHSVDYWWSLKTTVGNISIDSCEPNARSVPKAWMDAYIGEPASIAHSYTNYLKADPDSLIVHSEHGKFLDKVPNYPKIHDFYKTDPVISVGVSVPNGWQKVMREINAELGAKKQVDIAVVLTNIKDPTYAQAIEAKWLYGPKNSITVIIGVADNIASWVRVISINKVESLKVHLRDQIQGINIHGPEIPKIIHDGVAKEFKRRPMEDFEYLASTAEPSTFALIILYVVGFLLSIGLSFFMHRNDVFGDEGFRMIRRRK